VSPAKTTQAGPTSTPTPTPTAPRTPAPTATRTPTAPVAAVTLIAGYAVAAGTGSRPLGGVVLLAGGLWCVRAWSRRNDTRTAAVLACAGLAAFVLSHVLARAIGAWPAVLVVAAGMAVAAWLRADARAHPLAL
jgi:hypothetical protein